MVLARYGVWLDPDEIAGLLPSGPGIGDLAVAARHHGLEGEPLRLDPASCGSLAAPAIVLMKDGGAAVFEGPDGASGVRLNDSAEGSRVVPCSEFTALLAGLALPLRPTAALGRPRSGPPRLRELLAVTRPGRPALAMVFAVVLVLVVPGFVLPAAVQVFVDDVMTRRFVGWIFWLFVGLVVASALLGGLNALQEYSLRRAQAAVGTALGSRLFWRLLHVPVLFYAKTPAGTALQRLDAATQFAQTIAEIAGKGLTSAVQAPFYGCLLFVYSPRLAAVCVLLTAGNLFATQAIGRRRAMLLAAQQRQAAALTSTSVHGLRAIETLKSMGAESFFFRRWADANAAVVGAQQRIDSLSISFNLVPQALAAAVSAVAIAYGALLCIQGALSLGSLVAFQMLLTRFSRPAGEVVATWQRWQQASAQFGSVSEALRAPLDPAVRPRPLGPSEQKLSGHVELRRVSFSYDVGQPLLIQDLDLVLRPGARVALVGGSGSGKSTVGKLVVGLLRPVGGEVLFDGHPADHISRPVLTGSVGYVDQEIHLFAGSVRDSLTLLDPTIPLEVVRGAGRDACIDDVVAGRAGGYDSPVAEGGENFSGGQQQRLEIARALVREPTILVLDEATAALDAETERRIDENLRRRGCTCLIIAHRLSTIRDADEIIVMDRGRVAERGTHASLMAAGGRYAALVTEAG